MTAASKNSGPKTPLTVHALWKLIGWGAAAACALLIAFFAAQGDIDSGRLPKTLFHTASSSPPPPIAEKQSAPSFDAQAETRRLSEAVRDLAEQNDELKSRVAIVEHTVDDVTGSIAQHAEAVKPSPSAESASSASAEPPSAQPPAAVQPASVTASPAPAPTEYAIDIGNAVSIPTLRARWAGIHFAHPNLFNGLRPVVTLKQLTHPNRVELRLVVGPLASINAAAALCADLAPYRLGCRPTVFDGQHLSLE